MSKGLLRGKCVQSSNKQVKDTWFNNQQACNMETSKTVTSKTLALNNLLELKVEIDIEIYLTKLSPQIYHLKRSKMLLQVSY